MRATEKLVLTAEASHGAGVLEASAHGLTGYQAHYLRLASEQQRLLEMLGELRWTMKKLHQEVNTARALRFLAWHQSQRLELTLPEIVAQINAVVQAAHPDKHGGDDPVGTEVMKLLLPLRESLRAVLAAIQEPPEGQARRV